eukprot:CAMPEP_0118640280 /NCGR_PEP_ID=MMETSP0785-20121206/4669_1 /TAXON_ID=91992 /ORGANISM="Bolidomonas pacifica, Strain CCMP 1866" /LENGTH=166 /DNA_ID=CAMNT_0006531657 /DNA_START=239 /DNA_END=739 /DNA_ORIENTATION=+
MIIAGSVGIIVEFYPFKFIVKWFMCITCWPGKALYYFFWGLITWDYSNSEIISNGDKWKIAFSIIIVTCAGCMLFGWIFAMKSTAICEKSKFDEGERESSSNYGKNDVETGGQRKEKASKKGTWWKKSKKADVPAAPLPSPGPPPAAPIPPSPQTPSFQPAWATGA